MRRKLTWLLAMSLGILLLRIASAQQKPQFPEELVKLMEEVQERFKPLQDAARFSKAKFETQAKHEELAQHATRMAELMKQTTKFAPEKDLPDKPKKEWNETCETSAKYALELAAAARKKDYSAYRKAFKSMDAACTRCHEIFR
ncbi:MAG: cytochrome c [Gemmatales bacterium]|nr:cytochrome c [Gemmatales bacterium]MDW7993638.1 cytochrome c [Gemmatales bacterium]